MRRPNRPYGQTAPDSVCRSRSLVLHQLHVQAKLTELHCLSPHSQLASHNQAQTLRKQKRRSVLSFFSGFRKNHHSATFYQDADSAGQGGACGEECRTKYITLVNHTCQSYLSFRAVPVLEVRGVGGVRLRAGGVNLHFECFNYILMGCLNATLSRSSSLTLLLLTHSPSLSCLKVCPLRTSTRRWSTPVMVSRRWR